MTYIHKTQDTPSQHLAVLLKYMYEGQVSVQEDQLVSLLASAKALGIKGLSEVEEKNEPASRDPSPRKRMRKQDNNINMIATPPPPIEEIFSVGDDDDEIVEVEPRLEPEGGGVMEAYEEHENFAAQNEELNSEYYCEGDETMGSIEGSDIGLPCPYCPKVFVSNWHLKRHVLTHTKENRFQCSVCQKDFSRNDNLKSHMKTIHGVVLPSKQKS